MNKVLKNTIDKYHIMLSYDEINEFYRLFHIVEQQMVQMKIKGLLSLVIAIMLQDTYLIRNLVNKH